MTQNDYYSLLFNSARLKSPQSTVKNYRADTSSIQSVYAESSLIQSVSTQTEFLEGGVSQFILQQLLSEDSIWNQDNIAVLENIELKAKMSNLQLNNQQLQHQLTELQIKFNEHQMCNKQIEAQYQRELVANDKLSRELIELKNSSEVYTQQLDEMQQKINCMELDFVQLKLQNSTLITDIQKTQSQFDEKDNIISQLKNTIEQKVRQNCNAEDSRSHLLDDYLQQVSQLTTTLAMKDDQIFQCNQQNSDLQSTIKLQNLNLSNGFNSTFQLLVQFKQHLDLELSRYSEFVTYKLSSLLKLVESLQKQLKQLELNNENRFGNFVKIFKLQLCNALSGADFSVFNDLVDSKFDEIARKLEKNKQNISRFETMTSKLLLSYQYLKQEDSQQLQQLQSVIATDNQTITSLNLQINQLDNTLALYQRQKHQLLQDISVLRTQNDQISEKLTTSLSQTNDHHKYSELSEKYTTLELVQKLQQSELFEATSCNFSLKQSYSNINSLNELLVMQCQRLILLQDSNQSYFQRSELDELIAKNFALRNAYEQKCIEIEQIQQDHINSIDFMQYQLKPLYIALDDNELLIITLEQFLKSSEALFQFDDLSEILLEIGFIEASNGLTQRIKALVISIVDKYKTTKNELKQIKDINDLRCRPFSSVDIIDFSDKETQTFATFDLQILSEQFDKIQRELLIILNQLNSIGKQNASYQSLINFQRQVILQQKYVIQSIQRTNIKASISKDEFAHLGDIIQQFSLLKQQVLQVQTNQLNDSDFQQLVYVESQKDQSQLVQSQPELTFHNYSMIIETPVMNQENIISSAESTNVDMFKLQSQYQSRRESYISEVSTRRSIIYKIEEENIKELSIDQKFEFFMKQILQPCKISVFPHFQDIFSWLQEFNKRALKKPQQIFRQVNNIYMAIQNLVSYSSIATFLNTIHPFFQEYDFFDVDQCVKTVELDKLQNKFLLYLLAIWTKDNQEKIFQVVKELLFVQQLFLESTVLQNFVSFDGQLDSIAVFNDYQLDFLSLKLACVLFVLQILGYEVPPCVKVIIGNSGRLQDNLELKPYFIGPTSIFKKQAYIPMWPLENKEGNILTVNVTK